MELDVLTLSRLQFAFTIMFHYLFPPLTIGLGVVLVYLKGMHLWTKEAIYDKAAKFWTKIFGVNFALGVVTGIVMEFEFGTNWAAYSRYVGDVFGSALAAEGIFAFFLESGFLAVLLFGWDRVGPRMHFFSAVMVALGSIFSSIWITVANSWQQTPAGFELRPTEFIDPDTGEPFMRAEIVDFWAMVFNPSTVDRLVHVWIGAIILGAFFVMSVSAYYLLRGRHLEFAQRSFTGGLILGTVFSLAQMGSGHFQAKSVVENQPAKMAAMEGVFETERGVPINIVGWPNEETGKVEYSIGVPGMLSFLATGSFDGEVKGLNELEPKYGKPPVWLTFQAYHIMIGLGVLFLVSTLYAMLQWWRGRLFEQRWLLWYFVFAVVLAFAANECGWVSAEVGRQPWVVYPTVVDGQVVGGLRTSDGLSEVVKADQVLGSIIMFGIVYFTLFVLWIIILNYKIQQGPEPVESRADSEDGTGVLEAAVARTAKRGTLIEVANPETPNRGDR